MDKCSDNVFQMDGAKGATGEGVLANFFNSLLTKKTGGAAGPPSKAGEETVN